MKRLDKSLSWELLMKLLGYPPKQVPDSKKVKISQGAFITVSPNMTDIQYFVIYFDKCDDDRPLASRHIFEDKDSAMNYAKTINSSWNPMVVSDMAVKEVVSNELKQHLHQDNHNNIVRQKNDEIYILKEELQKIQRLPHMDKARASAVIMQVAAQLAKMPEHQKAKQLKKAVDQWATYTAKVEAERDKLLSLLQMRRK